MSRAATSALAAVALALVGLAASCPTAGAAASREIGPAFMQRAKAGVVSDRGGQLEIQLRAVEGRALFASTAGGAGEMGAKRFVRRWIATRGTRAAARALIAWRASASGPGAAVVKLSAPTRRGSTLTYRVRRATAPGRALRALFDDEPFGTSLPKRMRGVTVGIAGLGFTPTGCVLGAAELGRCAISGWNQRRWLGLVGGGHSASVEAGLTSGGTASGIFTYYEIGEKRDPVILMLGGVGTTKTEWDPVFLEALSARGYRLIVVDYPGVGTASIDDYSNFTISNLADFSIALVRKLGLKDPNVLGWAFSGKIAGLMFDRYGSELGDYIDIAGNIYNPDHTKIPSETVEALTSTDPLPAMYEAFPHTLDGLASGVGVALRGLSHEQEPREEDFESAYANAEEEWQYGTESVDLAKITSPTLILAGGLDDIAPASTLEEASGLLGTTDVSFHDFTRGGHALLYQFRNQAVARIAKRLGG